MLEDRVQGGTDRVTLNLGSLRSEIILELHTYHAARLWAGRKPNAADNRQGVMGLTGFLRINNIIKISSSQDDPYADMMMIQVEEKVEDVIEKFEAMRDQVKQIIATIPKQLSISENLNMQPARMPLFVNTPLGYQGVYLLISFDELARDIVLANHVGKLGRAQMEEMLDQAAHQLRSLFALVQNYRNTGVTRDDIAANNPRAREVVERYGLPPQDILEGIRRSKYAPAIKKQSGGFLDEQELIEGDEMEAVPEDVSDAVPESNGAENAAATTKAKAVRKSRAAKEVSV